jgi:hypothetical protein
VCGPILAADADLRCDEGAGLLVVSRAWFLVVPTISASDVCVVERFGEILGWELGIR